MRFMEFPSIDTTVKFSKVCHLIVFQVIWENVEHFAVIEQLESIIFISQYVPDIKIQLRIKYKPHEDRSFCLLTSVNVNLWHHTVCFMWVEAICVLVYQMLSTMPGTFLYTSTGEYLYYTCIHFFIWDLTMHKLIFLLIVS